MKLKTFLAALLISFLCFGQAAYSQSIAIKPYTDFLDQPHLSAKEYILSLYDRYDIVVFCERTHDELTQYHLLKDIFSDKRFIDQVGHIYMELGRADFDSKINSYLHAVNLTPEQSTQKALEIQRDAMWYPLWNRYNYHYLLTTLYDINRSLPRQKKLSLHPTDLSVDWQKIRTKEDVKKAILDSMDFRDSVMAHNMIRTINQVTQSKGARQKHFIILNTAHSLQEDYVVMNILQKPAAKWLFEYYPGKVANVLTNYESIPRDFSTMRIDDFPPILKGQWDAALYNQGKDDIGFDIIGSPLENKLFENMPLLDSTLTNEKVYTGYIFYKFFPQQEFVNGIPGIINDSYATELYRRDSIFRRKQKPKEEYLNDYRLWYNIKRTQGYSYLISLWQAVMQWLEKDEKK